MASLLQRREGSCSGQPRASLCSHTSARPGRACKCRGEPHSALQSSKAFSGIVASQKGWHWSEQVRQPCVSLVLAAETIPSIWRTGRVLVSDPKSRCCRAAPGQKRDGVPLTAVDRSCRRPCCGAQKSQEWESLHQISFPCQGALTLLTKEQTFFSLQWC